MNLSSGYFPPNGYRRKQTAGSYNFSLNNQNHHPATTSTLPSARSSNESSNGNETLLSSFMYNDRYRPHRQNDFANNHLFLAKRKLAGLFGQPTKSLHSKSDLIHLFDSQEPHRKTQQTSNKLKRSEGLLLKTSSNDHDLHLSVVNLDIKPPHPSIQTRDPLASIIRYRSIRQPTKISRQTTEIVKPANLHSNSLQIFADNHDTDEFNDDEAISDSMTVFDSSILTVKSIGPHNLDVYQEWAGATVAFEESFLKLKRTLKHTEYLTFYSVNCDKIELLKSYRGNCEPLLLFYGNNILVHVEHHINIPTIEKVIEEQLNKEIQVIKESRKREAVKMSVLSSDNAQQNNEKTSTSIEPMLYQGESISLKSLLMKTAEKIDQDYWLNPEPYKLGIALFVIKPDLIANGKKDEIFNHLRNNGFVIHMDAEKLLNEEDLSRLFKPDSDNLQEFTRFMSSGASVYAIVSKGHTGRSTADDLRQLIGPTNPDLAKETNPECLIAVYGTDSILNGFYASHTNHDALNEISIVFPDYHPPMIEGKSIKEYVQKTATLCILGPMQVQTKKGAIIQSMIDHGFEIRYEKSYRFRPDEVESLYIKHHNNEFFRALIEAYTSGPCLLLYIVKENCVPDFCEYLGPFSREEFISMPGTLRCDFDEPTLPVTTIHGSESVIDARKELEQFFPYQQTLAIIKPGLTPNQKDDILKRLNANGFTIMIKETKYLSKDILTQFYSRHQGLPWFDDFIRYMSSNVCELLILAREDAVQALRDLMGPVDPVRAKTDAPDSIRAIFGLDVMRNALHASSNNKHAREEIRLLFPDYEFVKTKPVPFSSSSSRLSFSADNIAIRVRSNHIRNNLYSVVYRLAVQTKFNGQPNEESAVFVTLLSKSKRTRKFLLQFSETNIYSLQTNQIDLFHFLDQDIGIPKFLKLSHDGRGFPRNWQLTSIEVTIPDRNKRFRFDINELISEENGQNMFPVTDVQDIDTNSSGNCAIIIQTGHAKYANTSADCSILFSGIHGVYSYELHHSLTNRIPFQNRSRDIFLVDIDQEIQSIILEHNNENSSPAWFIDFLIIKFLTNQQEYFFPISRWLSRDYFDGKTKIILSTKNLSNDNTMDLLENRTNVIRYEIRLQTGSMYNAGTNEPVWITLYGMRGTMITKYLEIAENEFYPFEPESNDIFVLYDIDLGEIDKLILGHECQSADEGWFVQTISVHVPSRDYHSETFAINKWLNSKRDDGIPLIEIQIRKPLKLKQNQKQRPSVVPQISAQLTYENGTSHFYTIYILTEEFQSELIEPRIFIDLIEDETNSTDFIRLKSKSPIRDNLGKNIFSEFHAYGKQIDQIKTIRLLIRTPDQLTRWLFRYILIEIDHTKQIYQFDNTKWIDSTELNQDFQMFTLSVQSQFSFAEFEQQLAHLKQIYANETDQMVINKSSAN